MTTLAIEPQPVLTVTERAALLECEAKIRSGLQSFVLMGQALARIRDSKLYREEFPTFEDYCLVKWDMTARRARQLWAAAEVVESLVVKDFAALPVTESQARPLTLLPKEERIPAWEEALRTAPDGKLTASHVAAVVQGRLNRITPAAADTPVPAKPAVVDLPNLATREERIRAIAIEAQKKLRELEGEIGTADAIATSGVASAISGMDEVLDHLVRKEEMLEARKGRVAA